MADLTAHFEHETIDGDRWDLLAYRYYGDARQQAVLIEANRAKFTDPVRVPPMILTAGLTLVVPILDDQIADQSDLPPWKRDGATYA